MKFAFIRDHHTQFPIEVLCDVLKASRSAYYAWSTRPASPAASRRDQLVEHIRVLHDDSRTTYGTPRVYQMLKAQGVACRENTVAKLMKSKGLKSKAKRRFLV